MCLANVCQGPKDKSGWEKPSNALLHQLLSNFLSGKGHKSCKKFVFAFLIGDTGTPLHPMKTNRPSLKINLKVCSKKKKESYVPSSHCFIYIKVKSVGIPDQRKFCHIAPTAIVCILCFQSLKLMSMFLQHGTLHLNNNILKSPIVLNL